jgi:uncharacterized membrane protein
MPDDVSRPAPSDQRQSTASTWRHGRLLATNRLEAFSDGVFAIAITLLVLELHVPAAKEGLLGELGKEWPMYLGYVISFAFIGGGWIAHANMTRLIQAADAAFLRLNLLYLLFISLLPFTTSLMATQLGGAESRIGVFLFGLNLTLGTVVLSVSVGHAARTPGIADDTAAKEELHSFGRERRAPVIVLAVATVGGIFLPTVAAFVFLIVSVVFLIEPLWQSGRQRRRGPEDG